MGGYSKNANRFFNKVWADENFLYVKIHGPKSKVGGYGGDDEWRRYAIAEYKNEN